MTKWKRIKYLRQGESLNYDYELSLPLPLADWDVFDYWERERVISMRENLNFEDILFDIGAEHGWMSVVFDKFCRVFLIEPTPEFWPNIHQTWIENSEKIPVGCFCGLIGAETSFAKEKDNNPEFVWPPECKGKLIDKNKYRYLNGDEKEKKVITIDDLVSRSGIVPTALTIDVEGAEFEVLFGARNLLTNYDIKVWVSIHPDLSLKNYDRSKEDVIEIMSSYGYANKFIHKDHEEHWFFYKKNSTKIMEVI